MSLRKRKNHSPKPPQDCPLLTCTSVIGGAWTPSIIWYLSGGPRRFTELKGDIPPITARVLTKRLRELEEQGIVDRHVMPTSPPSVEYTLTDLGRELLPAIQAIVDVGTRLQALGAQDAPR
ncbi:DNA-binding HxlR family transcriptional regulator [Rubricella aquisinus]|uniref:DNA-binding HxlR family transcriptional regulator n=1 Tax=Rubricella aquisinus TaxID=2028108 RepID=A0A840WKD7_9RHOB|nr:helix-turn-helix domain-containing protein [Rubricella aquisinus]MBB5515558.1 DNA-binding HxlR family transcriptional regulator [Rubricella aquisinus]